MPAFSFERNVADEDEKVMETGDSGGARPEEHRVDLRCACREEDGT